MTTSSTTPIRVAVMGAGSWGTAFSLVLADAGCQVALWTHRAEQAEAINRERTNSAFFPDLPLPAAIEAHSDAQQAMAGAEFVVLAIPSQALRENLARWQLPSDVVLVSLAKGIELGTGLRMSQLIREVTGIAEDRIAVVSGPNLAREIAIGQPAASVVACTSEETATRLQVACHTARFRAYTNTDVIGVELGGATKNVIALAVGIAVGFGFGDNSKASVITRGLAETTRLGVALGAHPYTFSGLAGLGDLVATCSSPLSRNRTFGEALGRGRTVAEIAASTRQVAEGVKSCSSIRQLARNHDVEMPIVEAVDAVIAGQVSPSDMIDALMARAARPERY